MTESRVTVSGPAPLAGMAPEVERERLLQLLSAATFLIFIFHTQPLLAGIVTTLGGPRGGQAMGLNAFLLFMGFGLGSVLFAEALRLGFAAAPALFSGAELFAAVAGIAAFRLEARALADSGRVKRVGQR